VVYMCDFCVVALMMRFCEKGRSWAKLVFGLTVSEVCFWMPISGVKVYLVLATFFDIFVMILVKRSFGLKGCLVVPGAATLLARKTIISHTFDTINLDIILCNSTFFS